MDSSVAAAIATAVGLCATAVFGYLGVRGANRRQAQQGERDADLNRLRIVIDEMAEDNERTRARADRAETRTDECERREQETRREFERRETELRREIATMRHTMEALLVREERRQQGHP